MVRRIINIRSAPMLDIAAEQPLGVPEENWLPINHKDEALDIVMRIYDPDMEKIKT